MKTSLILSALFNTLAYGKLWAQFCDDTSCSEHCGIPVDVGNSDCLAHEGNRRSIKYHGSAFIGHFLVFSPGTDCNCQNDCIDIQGAGISSCVDITDKATAQSFRFQETTCIADEGVAGTGNNCPPSSSHTTSRA